MSLLDSGKTRSKLFHCFSSSQTSVKSPVKLSSCQVGNQLSVSHKSRSKPGLKSLCVKSGFIFVDVADQKLRITNQLQPNSNWSHINVDGLITPEHIN